MAACIWCVQDACCFHVWLQASGVYKTHAAFMYGCKYHAWPNVPGHAPTERKQFTAVVKKVTRSDIPKHRRWSGALQGDALLQICSRAVPHTRRRRAVRYTLLLG
eukprot:366561-Chlamydomonas_euryale.AAC.14